MKKLLILVVIIVAGIVLFLPKQSSLDEPKNKTSLCKGEAACLEGIVTKVVDGDTLDVNGIRVRLSLVNAPEIGTPPGESAKKFAETVCAVGSPVLFDQDDLQKIDSFGRMLGTVKCGYVNLNQALLESGLAVIETKFCPESEFKNEEWAVKFGC